MFAWKLLCCSACNRSASVLKFPSPWKITTSNRPICRTLYESIIGKSASDRTLSKLKLKDGMPNESELIYRANYDYYYQGSYICVMISSVAFPAWLIYMAHNSNYKLPIHITEELELSSVLEVSLFVSMISVLGIVSAIILSRYPLRIYHNPASDKYTAVYKNVALQTIHQHFKRGEVIAIPENNILPTQISRYKIKGGKTILNEDRFRRPSDLIYMMGFRVNKDDIDLHDSDDNMH